METQLHQPIIFVGNGRSGSTIIFELFSTHDNLGWLSNYSQSFPKLPFLNLAVRLFDNKHIFIRGETKQHRKIYPLNRFLPRPTEGYPYWENFVGNNFSYEYLINTKAADSEVRSLRNNFKKILRYQGKQRLTIKVTGPTRIEYLHSIFPDARFVHIIRDGRAVTSSLMEVDFWKSKGGFDKPFWSNGFSEKYNEIWLSKDKDPTILAALQWRNIIEIGRIESKALKAGQYSELLYENFMKSPHEELSKLFAQSDLLDSSRAHKFINQRIRPTNMNYKFMNNFDKKTLDAINEILGDLLDDLGYVI